MSAPVFFFQDITEHSRYEVTLAMRKTGELEGVFPDDENGSIDSVTYLHLASNGKGSGEHTYTHGEIENNCNSERVQCRVRKCEFVSGGGENALIMRTQKGKNNWRILLCDVMCESAKVRD